MTCTDVEQREIAEDYLLGRLNEADREAFEQHYFECSRCYSELEALRAVREGLARLPRPSARPGGALWLAIAAAMILAVSAAIGWQTLRFRGPAQPAARSSEPAPRALPTPPDGEEIARLAAVAPPPYSAARFRDGAERAAFTSGMRRYLAHDFPGAIPPLEQAVRESPAADDARFYLGASYLLAGRSRDAIATLEPVARTRSPYAEEAQFLSAKACLQAGDLRAALAALDTAIAMHGDREQEARSLRDRVAALSPPR